jgi:Holliday junction resolvase RusA-like endonuclease
MVDLPFPPSTNRIWRHESNNRRKMIHLSAEYRAWKAQADACALADRGWRSKARMPGPFSAAILLSRRHRAGDVDNRIKAVLDWAQRVELIRNDSLAEEITARWVDPGAAPTGCRLILRSIA